MRTQGVGGLLHTVDLDARTLTIDVIQFLTGQAALATYHAARPDVPAGSPNNHYIVNDNSCLRTQSVDTAVEVRLVRLYEGRGAALKDATREELPAYLPAYRFEEPADDRCARSGAPVEAGHVAGIQAHIPLSGLARCIERRVDRGAGACNGPSTDRRTG